MFSIFKPRQSWSGRSSDPNGRVTSSPTRRHLSGTRVVNFVCTGQGRGRSVVSTGVFSVTKSHFGNRPDDPWCRRFRLTIPGVAGSALASASASAHLTPDKRSLVAPPLERTISSIGSRGNHSPPGQQMVRPKVVKQDVVRLSKLCERDCTDECMCRRDRRLRHNRRYR